MKINIRDKKIITDKWFAYLQFQICKEFESLDKGKKFARESGEKNKNEEVANLFCLQMGTF